MATVLKCSLYPNPNFQHCSGITSVVSSAGKEATGGLSEERGHLYPCLRESHSSCYGVTWACARKITGASSSSFVSVDQAQEVGDRIWW